MYVCMFANYPLVQINLPDKTRAPAEVKRMIFSHCWTNIDKTDKDVRQHRLISMTVSESDPLITCWWHAGKNKNTEVWLFPSLKGSSILPSLVISSLFVSY